MAWQAVLFLGEKVSKEKEKTQISIILMQFVDLLPKLIQGIKRENKPRHKKLGIFQLFHGAHPHTSFDQFS